MIFKLRFSLETLRLSNKINHKPCVTLMYCVDMHIRLIYTKNIITEGSMIVLGLGVFTGGICAFAFWFLLCCFLESNLD